MSGEWEAVGRILSSKTRKKVFYSLKKERMPSEICRETKLPSSNVSRTLRELEEMGIIKCLNPKLKKGRIYSLTKKGESVYNKVKTTGN